MHGSSPLQLAASSHLPRDTSLKTADGTSKNYTPDVQLIAGLHLLKQLQTYTSNSHMYTGVCVCTLTHRHTDTRTHRHTDTGTSRGVPDTLQGAAGGGSVLLGRLPQFCLVQDFFIFIFSQSETIQAKKPRGSIQVNSVLLCLRSRKTFMLLMLPYPPPHTHAHTSESISFNS